MTHALVCCPPYSAVSYTWGDPLETEEILLNDKVLPVRNNLWSLLSSLRRTDEPRRLWIDAICINQSDIAEKNHQVALMGRIYEGAQSVLVWLGRGNGDTNIAFETVERLQFYNSKDEGRHRSRWHYICLGQNVPQGLLPDQYIRGEEVEAFAILCKQLYWVRTWIIQEFVLAKSIELRCGGRTIHWHSVDRFVRGMADYKSWHSSTLPHLSLDQSVVAKIPAALSSMPFPFGPAKASASGAS